MRCIAELLGNFRRGVLQVKPGDFGARRQQGVHSEVAQAEELADNFLLNRFEDAALRTLLNQDAHLFVGYGRFGGGFGADDAQNEIGGRAEETHKGRHHL